MVIARVLHLWEISDFFALKKMQRINLKYTESEVKNFGQYYKAGHSVKQVAEHFNIKYRDALHYLIYFGYYIPTRKQSNVQNMCKVNDFFETIDTSDKAYYLGLLMSDGYINKTIYNKEVGLALKASDKYILDKLNNYVSPEKLVVKYRNSYKWHVVSPKMYDDLMQYGIVENKSHIDYSYPNIPKEFDKDFIRGYFDGDGCITIKSTGYIVISICCNSKVFIESLAKKLNSYGIQTRPIFTSTKDKVNPIHTLYISGRENKSKFRDFLYENAETYLKRKYDKFMEIPC